MLLSLGLLATAIDVKAHPNTESSTLELNTIEANRSFLFGKDSAGISTNIPTPPVAPTMPEFISDASSGGKSENRSALFKSIRNFGKGVLRKVKRESKPKNEPAT